MGKKSGTESIKNSCGRGVKLLENARIGGKKHVKKIGLGQKTTDSLENHKKTGGLLKVEKRGGSRQEDSRFS